MITTPNASLWITEAARDRLQAELQELESAAADGRSEARLAEIKSLLRQSEVGAKPDDGLVEAGMTVTVQLEGETGPTTFLLAQREIAGLDPDVELDVYSPTSPLGAAIVGKFPGDEFSYTTASNRVFRGRVVGAVPFGA